MKRCACDLPHDAGRRAFFGATAAAASLAATALPVSAAAAESSRTGAPSAGTSGTGSSKSSGSKSSASKSDLSKADLSKSDPSKSGPSTLDPDKRKFMEEAARLATESVEKGWGGPFGAVIVKNGEIIGRGQNRVLLTGCPVFHAEITAIIDASAKLNPKALLGSDYGAGTILEMIPREVGSPDRSPERARMLKGCEIYVNGAPCPMCMSAIYWARIDHVYFGASLEDTSHIGFDDAFQYEDFTRPWNERSIAVTPDFEREIGLTAFRAWEAKKDRHPY